MRFAPVAAALPERRRITVAELLGQDLGPTRSPARHRGPARPAVSAWESTLTSEAVPPGWPGSTEPPRRGLSVSAGAVLATGAMIATAALGGQTERGPMGAGAADGGYPGVSRVPTAPSPVAPTVASPRRAVVTTAAVERAWRSSVPRPVVLERPPRPIRTPTRTASARTRRDAPAGSALSSLTPAITGADALVDPLI